MPWHRRYNPNQTLPVGRLWGKTGEGGVAGCMVWDDCVRESWNNKRKAIQTRLPASQHPHLTGRVTEHVTGHVTPHSRAPEVTFDPRLEDNYSSRTTGALKVQRPSTGTYIDKEKKYFYTSTTPVPPARDTRDYNPYVSSIRDTHSANTPFYEDAVIQAVRDYTKHERTPDVMVGDVMMGAKPPKPPSSHRNISTTTATHRGRKVEFREDLRIRSRPNTPTGAYTPKVTGRSNDALGHWQDTVDDLLLDNRTDNELMMDILSRPTSALRYKDPNKPDYFEMWKQSQTAPSPMPSPPKSIRNTPSRNGLNSDHKWLMSKYRRSAKARVDSHWDTDPFKPRPDSKVNVNFDCPEDSDMTVSVVVHNNTDRYNY